MFRCLSLLAIGAALLFPAEAAMDPAAWHSSPLPNAEAGGNEFHFWPDGTLNPRVLVAGTGGTWRLAGGGPPTWTGGQVQTLGLNGQGFFLPDGLANGSLFSAAGSAGARSLQMGNFIGGIAFPEPVDEATSAGLGAIHASYDPTMQLHVSYVRTLANGLQYLCYARRSLSGGWQIAPPWPMPAGTTVNATVVVAPTYDTPQIYYSLSSAQGTVLSRIRLTYETQPGTGISFFRWWGNTGLVSALHPGSRPSFFGTPENGRLLYSRQNFGVTSIDMLMIPAGVQVNLWTEPNPVSSRPLQPRGIVGAFGQNGQARVAWYEARHGNIHYLRPDGTGAGNPTVPGTPVHLGENLPDADLRGFYFDPLGRPYLLYRRSLTEGGVAFLKDDFDFNGNGRPDFWDMALGENGTIRPLPVAEAVPGAPGSANRFKVAFPVVDSIDAAVSNATLLSTAANIRYRLAVSTDLRQWTIKTADVVFSSLGPTAPGSSHLTIVAHFTDNGPEEIPRRFVRLVFDRPGGGY